MPTQNEIRKRAYAAEVNHAKRELVRLETDYKRIMAELKANERIMRIAKAKLKEYSRKLKEAGG